MHYGPSNEIEEIKVCKKCPKVKHYCAPIFIQICSKLFLQNFSNCVPNVFLCQSSRQILGVFLGFVCEKSDKLENWRAETIGPV